MYYISGTGSLNAETLLMVRIILSLVPLLLFFTGAFSQTVDPAKDWRLGIQLWTFNTSSFRTAIKKADSCRLKYVEAYPGQVLQDGRQSIFGPTMSAEERKELKQFLHKKGIKVVSLGVIVARTKKEWEQYFRFAADMNIPVIVAEPEFNQLNDVNRLASAYNVQVALHNQPAPDIYWRPDSALLAMKNHGNLGVCADLGNWARSGLNVVDCIKKCSNRIMEVHLKDVAEFGNHQAKDVLLGEGVCNLPGVLQQLRRQDFKGVFIIEYEENAENNVPAIRQYVQYFHDHLNQ